MIFTGPLVTWGTGWRRSGCGSEWERAACGDGYTAATRLVRCVCREPSRSGLLGGLSARLSIYQAIYLSIYLTSEPVCRCAPMMSELYLR